MINLYETMLASRFAGPGSAAGTTEHAALDGRDLPNQHPISAIEGLAESLEKAHVLEDFICATEADAPAKTVKLLDGQAAPSNGTLSVVQFVHGNSAKAISLEFFAPNDVVIDKYELARTPGRYSDVHGPHSGVIGEFPEKYCCLIYFREAYAYWLNPPSVRPLIIDFDQFGFNLDKILAGNSSIVNMTDNQIPLADEIKNKLTQAGGVYMYIKGAKLLLKLGDLVEKETEYSISAYDGTSCYRFVCDYARKRLIAEKIEVARATAIHTNMVVSAWKENGTYKADKTAKEILDHHNNYGHVEMRYFDETENKVNVYQYETYDALKNEAIFRRVYPDNDMTNRINVCVDNDMNVRTVIEDMSGKSLGLTDAHPGDFIEVEEADPQGRPTKWRVATPVKIDDLNISAKTAMSSAETAYRLSPVKTYHGESEVQMNPVEGYPWTISCEINPMQQNDGVPSVSNERSISGWDNVQVTVDNTDGGKEYNQPLGKTVYGGTYEPNTGELTINLVSRTFNGGEAWQIKDVPNGRTPVFRLNVPGLSSSANIHVQRCNIFKTGPLSEPAWDSDCVWAIGDDVYVGNGIAVQYGKDVNQFKAQLARTNMQLVYELATPQKETFEPKKIVAIGGKNIVRCSAGGITVTTPVVEITDNEFAAKMFEALQMNPALKELVKSIADGQV